MLLFDAERCRHPRHSACGRGLRETNPVLALMLLVATLPCHPDSLGRGNRAKREGNFCREGCSPSLSLSGLAGTSAPSLAPLPAGLMSSRGGGSEELAVCVAFPPASHPHRDSLRGDSSEQIAGEGLR